MHIHILGIGGTFMGGVALLAKAAGHRVTGCDENVYPPMSTQLERLGIEFIEGYDPAQLATRPDYVVIGNALSRGNPLVEAVLDHNVPYCSGPQWLTEHVLHKCHVIAVSGTHGKTTTASLLAWMLEQAGLEPGFLIGGIPANFGESARFGGGKIFVVEADEYDTAFFDKRAKFVHYRPRTLIINNLEFDHADIYADIDAILWQFHQLLRCVPASGKVIVNAEDGNIDRLLKQGCWSDVQRFALERNVDDESSAESGQDLDWHARFDDAGERRVSVTNCASGQAEPVRSPWKLSGRHNLENALAAIAGANAAGVAVETAVQALAGFDGVKRRLERTATVQDIAIYDDFAHHPTAIRRTLEGLRQRFPKDRLVVALEPRSNTMKLGIHGTALGESLTLADQVFVYRSADVADTLDADLQPVAGKLDLVTSYDALLKALDQTLNRGDKMIFMSNGSFGAVRQQLTMALRNRAVPEL